MPSLRQLYHFQAVMQNGSLRAAAEAAHITQPALTRSIGALESELGLKLFERSQAGMIPSDYARQVAPRYRALLQELEDLSREAALYRNLSTGELSVGLGQAVREPVIRQLMPAFAVEHPNIALTFREGSVAHLAGYLMNREVDLLIAGETSYREYEAITAKPLAELPIDVMVREGHPLLESPAVNLRQLAAYPLATPSVLGPRHPFRRILKDQDGLDLPPRYVCSDYQALFSIVQRTDAWIGVARSLVAAPSLVVLPVEHWNLRLNLSVLEITGRTRSPAAERFLHILAKMLQEQPGVDPGS